MEQVSIMKKPIKLSKLQLRNLINEAIEVKPAGEPEPFQIDEKFGTFDVKDQVDNVGMMPHNFESAHHEIFYQALQPVVNDMVKASMDIYDTGFAPEGRARAESDVKHAAEQMREELLEVVAKWSEEIVARIV
jgi:hypothetical protein